MTGIHVIEIQGFLVIDFLSLVCLLPQQAATLQMFSINFHLTKLDFLSLKTKKIFLFSQPYGWNMLLLNVYY